MRRRALAVGLSLAISAACAATAPSALAPSTPSALPSGTAAALPRPIPQPITRTSAAAQVAWLLSVNQQQMRTLTGVDSRGTIVGKIDVTKLGTSGIRRSADGASLVLFTEDRIDLYSALDGTRTKTYRATGTSVIASDFSSDGRWAALLLSGARMQLLDLRSGLSQTLPTVHDPKAQLPGLSGNIADVIWSSVAFAPDSSRVFVLSDWGGPARVTGYSLSGDTWAEYWSSMNRPGESPLACGGPAVATKVVQGGSTFAAFCHVSGAVWLFDLPTLTTVSPLRPTITVLQPTQKNPFWLSPIFTPDGQLLYLHQWPAFGDEMQVVDIATRRVLGPAPTPTRLGVPGPFAAFFGVALAGGTASTQPISPDGLKLYSAFSGGIAVMRVPDLAPIATLASGMAANEVWISGDGKTVFGIDGAKLVVASDDGGTVRTVDLGQPHSMFISSDAG